jgi:hypothetical protein
LGERKEALPKGYLGPMKPGGFRQFARVDAGLIGAVELADQAEKQRIRKGPGLAGLL